jgi:hypothetical protein
LSPLCLLLNLVKVKNSNIKQSDEAVLTPYSENADESKRNFASFISPPIVNLHISPQIINLNKSSPIINLHTSSQVV